MRLLLALPLLLALAACERQPGGSDPASVEAADLDLPPGKVDRSRAGTAAPEASFEDPAGEPVTLADFRGKPLLVNLWATWCAPCIAEMPTLDALAAKGRNLEVLAVSQDLEGAKKVDGFFAARKFKALEPYLDTEMALMGGLKVATLPTTILYDAEGREVWRMTGIEDWTGVRAAGLLGEAGVTAR